MPSLSLGMFSIQVCIKDDASCTNISLGNRLFLPMALPVAVCLPINVAGSSTDGQQETIATVDILRVQRKEEDKVLEASEMKELSLVRLVLRRDVNGRLGDSGYIYEETRFAVTKTGVRLALKSLRSFVESARSANERKGSENQPGALSICEVNWVNLEAQYVWLAEFYKKWYEIGKGAEYWRDICKRRNRGAAD